MIFIKLKFFYTTENLSYLRSLTASKICYRNSLKFLKLRHTLSANLSNRIVYRGDYLCSYKHMRRYYISTLRATFLKRTSPDYADYILKNFDNKEYLLNYFQYNAMKELDYSLVWRGLQTNSLFNIIVTRKKKKKKFIYKQNVYFITASKRLLFVWRWLSVIIRCHNVQKSKRHYALIPALENFLMAPLSSQILNNFKLYIYKLKLLRTV